MFFFSVNDLHILLIPALFGILHLKNKKQYSTIISCLLLVLTSLLIIIMLNKNYDYLNSLVYKVYFIPSFLGILLFAYAAFVEKSEFMKNIGNLKVAGHQYMVTGHLQKNQKYTSYEVQTVFPDLNMQFQDRRTI